MFSERDLLNRLNNEPLSLPPLTFERREPDRKHAEVDAMYDVGWNRRKYRFIAEIKARGTPQAIIAAAHHAKSLAYDYPGALPLVVVPYLSPSQLDQVEKMEGVSAIDLCGNGIVRAANEFVVFRSGRPNLFREVRPLKAAYRGTSSLVARALVLRHQFDSVSEVHEFIASHGGRITLGTISKALGRLSEDLVVAREGRGIRVVQVDKLLDQLRQNYRTPRIRARWIGKIPEATLHRRLLEVSERIGGRLVLTGLSSAKHHVTIATEPVAAYYCELDPLTLIRTARLDSDTSRAFPNVELLQTNDESVYFDPSTVEDRIVSSPVQTWLELAAGDKRANEASRQLYARLLEGTTQLKEPRHG